MQLETKSNIINNPNIIYLKIISSSFPPPFLTYQLLYKN